VPQGIDVEVASVIAWMASVHTGWEVAPRVGSVDVQSEASKRNPVVGIHDRGGISEADHLMGLHCCYESHVARESTDVPVEEPPAYQKSAVRHQG
jgi:hypothetical protein